MTSAQKVGKYRQKIRRQKENSLVWSHFRRKRVERQKLVYIFSAFYLKKSKLPSLAFDAWYNLSCCTGTSPVVRESTSTERDFSYIWCRDLDKLPNFFRSQPGRDQGLDFSNRSYGTFPYLKLCPGYLGSWGRLFKKYQDLWSQSSVKFHRKREALL